MSMPKNNMFFGLKPTMTKEQIEYVNSIYENRLTIVNAPAGTGKAQPLYSKIMTPTGYKTMGDMKIGTLVYGEDGKVHPVTGVFPQGIKDVYEVVFSDGSKTRCCDEHLWTYQTPHERDHDLGFRNTKTLKEIMNTPIYKENKGHKRWLYYIPVTNPIEFTEKEIEIDPYILGILIGDGGLTGGTVTASLYEKDIAEATKGILNQYGLDLIQIQDDRLEFRIIDEQKETSFGLKGIYRNRLKIALNKYGLLNKKSGEKFIPEEYKLNNPFNRIRLLKGLIDTDGETDGGAYIYSTSSKQLAEDIQFMVQSLGGTCSIGFKHPTYTYNREKKDGLLSYRLYIKIDLKIHESQKHESKIKQRNTKIGRTIREINYIGKEECQCIMIDSINHLYLTDDFIVTHNTTLAVGAAKLSGMKLIYIFSPVQEDAMGFRPGTQMEKEREYIAPLMGALIDIGENPNNVIFNEDLAKDPKAGKQMMEWEKNGTCWCYPRSHIFARGINIENRFVIIDEAQNYTHKELQKILTRIHDDCKIVIIGHTGQCDINKSASGFEDYIELFRDKPYAKVCTLSKNFRGELAQDADTIDDFLMKKSVIR